MGFINNVNVRVYIAVPTFIGFLQDVESPYEVIVIFVWVLSLISQ